MYHWCIRLCCNAIKGFVVCGVDSRVFSNLASELRNQCRLQILKVASASLLPVAAVSLFQVLSSFAWEDSEACYVRASFKALSS